MADEMKTLTAEALVPQAPATVWKYLTDSKLLAGWLMPNTFKLAEGEKFAFQSQPIGQWDGTVECQITEIAPNQRLVYSWKGGSAAGAQGATLDTTVTWVLTPVGVATKLTMVQAGFKLPANQFAFEAMSKGWASMIQRMINQVSAPGVAAP